MFRLFPCVASVRVWRFLDMLAAMLGGCVVSVACAALLCYQCVPVHVFAAMNGCEAPFAGHWHSLELELMQKQP